MANKKSILEQALLQVEALEAAVKSNAKGILSSTVKNELAGLLKENNEEEVEEPIDEVEDVTDPSVDDDQNDENAESDEVPSLEDDETEEEPSLEDGETEEPSLEDGETFNDEEEDDDTLDLTNANDEEVLKVFKHMKDEDGVIVKRNGDNIELQDGDNDYVIKLNEQFEDENEDDEDIYEIELDEDDFEDEENFGVENEGGDDIDSILAQLNNNSDEVPSENNEIPSEGEFSESARTKGFGYHGGLKSKKIFKAGNKRDEINEEVVKLKKQNTEYKKALNLFKEKLNEIAVFNSNLALATRLFTEHTTTKQEKLNILKRFDDINTISESKTLYGSITEELKTKKPITESIKNKIVSNPQTSTTEILSESKAYQNPQFGRIKDLMNKIK